MIEVHEEPSGIEHKPTKIGRPEGTGKYPFRQCTQVGMWFRIEGKTRKTSLGQLLINFGRNKLRPDLGAAWDVIDIATDRVQPGHSETAADVLGSLTIPLSQRELINVMKEHGLTEGAAIEALGIFGAGVQQYEDRPTR